MKLKFEIYTTIERITWSIIIVQSKKYQKFSQQILEVQLENTRSSVSAKPRNKTEKIRNRKKERKCEKGGDVHEPNRSLIEKLYEYTLF